MLVALPCWVTRRGSEPCESTTHRGRTQAKTPRCAGHAPLGEQRIQRRKQVHVHRVHVGSLSDLADETQRLTQL